MSMFMQNSYFPTSVYLQGIFSSAKPKRRSMHGNQCHNCVFICTRWISVPDLCLWASKACSISVKDDESALMGLEVEKFSSNVWRQLVTRL